MLINGHMWNLCFHICNYLEHKTAILLKIHKDVKSNSAPHCYVLISKFNSKLSFSLEHVGKRGDLRRKKYNFQTIYVEVWQFNMCTWDVNGCLMSGLHSDAASFKVWFLFTIYKELSTVLWLTYVQGLCFIK